MESKHEKTAKLIPKSIGQEFSNALTSAATSDNEVDVQEEF